MSRLREPAARSVVQQAPKPLARPVVKARVETPKVEKPAPARKAVEKPVAKPTVRVAPKTEQAPKRVFRQPAKSAQRIQTTPRRVQTPKNTTYRLIIKEPYIE